MFPALVPQLSAGRADSLEALRLGSTSAFADRTYGDGFVFMDDNTSAPNSFLPGTTAHWGYQNDSQVQSGSLAYHGGEYATTDASSGSTTLPGARDAGLSGASLALQLDALLTLNDRLRVGGTAGYFFTPMDVSRSVSTFSGFLRLDEKAFAVTDIYNLQGVIPPLAPYAGTLNQSGPAPLIDNIPSQRLITEVAASSQTAAFINRVDESLDLGLHTLSLGPTVEYAVGRFSFTGSLGLGLNIASWDASFQESLSQTTNVNTSEVRSWREHRSKTDVLPGFFIQGSAAYQLSDQWSISAFGRYDWNETLHGSVGPSTFSADLSGYTLGGFLTFNY